MATAVIAVPNDNLQDRSRESAELLSDVGQLIANGDVLWALILACSTTDAAVSRRTFTFHLAVSLALHIPASQHRPLIDKLEHAWDVDTLRTGHAVAARCTGDTDEGVVGIPDACDQVQVAGSQHAGCRRAGSVQILLNLCQRAHATEQQRDLGVVPYPVQGPFSRRPSGRGCDPHC